MPDTRYSQVSFVTYSLEQIDADMVRAGTFVRSLEAYQHHVQQLKCKLNNIFDSESILADGESAAMQVLDMTVGIAGGRHGFAVRHRAVGVVHRLSWFC